jgi:translation initiation factor IF-3
MSDYQKGKNSKDLGLRRNTYIHVPKVQLITEKGENKGTVDLQEALSMAEDAGLDLVEVSPNLKPPVCRIMDYSKYLYEQKKKARKSNAKKPKDLKEFKFSPVIDIGDKNTRIRRAKEFLDKGHPVKLSMWVKGRQSKDQAKEVFADILTNFTDYSSIESEPQYEGRQIFITFRLDGKAKNKQDNQKENQGDKSEGQQES